MTTKRKITPHVHPNNEATPVLPFRHMDRVVFVKDFYQRALDAVVPSGACGEVYFIDDETGQMLVQLDELHEDFAPWRNMAWVSPSDFSDITLSLRLSEWRG